MCLFIARRRRRRIHRGRVIIERRVAPTTTITRCAAQSIPPYTGQLPPSYQQAYPYYPPPEYGQPQTFNPPPYTAGVMAASEQPPPYPTPSEEESGGVNTPKRSYGTIPSAPDV